MTGTVSSYFVGVKGGLVMSMIAFSIVFLVIIGLMLTMIAIKYLAAAIEGGKGSGSGNKAVAAPQQQAPATPPAPAKAVAVRPEDDGALMAVISAAIAATLGSAARVIAFSPVVKAPASTSWKFVAKMSNIEGFQD